MTSQPARHVLVVDDMLVTCHDLRETFLAYNPRADSTYVFDVDIATSIDEAVEKVRARRGLDQYHVIVLDLSFVPNDSANRDGLRVAEALGLFLRLGQAIPVEIIFSGYTDLEDCVRAMRHGAWDVIDKSDDNDGSSFDRVVASAVLRLKSLDLQARVGALAVEYLQQHIASLQRRYGGQLIAIWHEPEVRVIAHGQDVFDLERQLAPWRAEQSAWRYPFITQIQELVPGVPHGGAR